MMIWLNGMIKMIIWGCVNGSAKRNLLGRCFPDKHVRFLLASSQHPVLVGCSSDLKVLQFKTENPPLGQVRPTVLEAALFRIILTDLFVPTVGRSSKRTLNDRQQRGGRGNRQRSDLELVLGAFVDYIDHYRYTSNYQLVLKTTDPQLSGEHNLDTILQ